jgi:hypothetical protein
MERFSDIPFSCDVGWVERSDDPPRSLYYEIGEPDIGGSALKLAPPYARHLAALTGTAAFLPLLLSFRGKRFAFASFRGFARSRYLAMAYGLLTHFFCTSLCVFFTFFEFAINSYSPKEPSRE